MATPDTNNMQNQTSQTPKNPAPAGKEFTKPVTAAADRTATPSAGAKFTTEQVNTPKDAKYSANQTDIERKADADKKGTSNLNPSRSSGSSIKEDRAAGDEGIDRKVDQDVNKNIPH